LTLWQSHGQAPSYSQREYDKSDIMLVSKNIVRTSMREDVYIRKQLFFLVSTFDAAKSYRQMKKTLLWKQKAHFCSSTIFVMVSMAFRKIFRIIPLGPHPSKEITISFTIQKICTIFQYMYLSIELKVTFHRP
jgi:hypothetical protein